MRNGDEDHWMAFFLTPRYVQVVQLCTRGASFEQEKGIGLEDFNLDWRTLIVIELLLNNGNEREMKITILKIGGATLMWVPQVTLFSIEVPREMETIAIGRYEN